MGIGRGQTNHQGRQALGQGVGVGRVIGKHNLGGAGDARRRFGDGAALMAGHQHVNRAQFQARGERMKGRRFEGGVVVFGNEKDAHQITLASLRSLSTSSAASATLTPAWRRGGSSTLRVTSRGAVSTPSSAGVKTSMVFFLAFMMLGRDA